MNVQPLNSHSVTPEFVLQELIKDDPKAILVIAIKPDGSLRLMHSSMPYETRCYLIHFAQAVIFQDILKGTQTGDPLKTNS